LKNVYTGRVSGYFFGGDEENYGNQIRGKSEKLSVVHCPADLEEPRPENGMEKPDRSNRRC
jgi:hypothetical protein